MGNVAACALCAGIDDALEEIVGEIAYEYDTLEPFCEMIGDNEAIFNTRMHMDDVNRMMNLHLPTGESDTLGGLIYYVLGGSAQG